MNEMNRQAQIRQGLTQYIGAMLTNTELSHKDACQVVVAALVEEAVKLSMTQDGVDFYIAKPLLRAIKYLYEQDLNKMAQEARKSGLEEQVVPAARKLLNDNLAFIEKTINAYSGDKSG